MSRPWIVNNAFEQESGHHRLLGHYRCNRGLVQSGHYNHLGYMIHEIGLHRRSSGLQILGHYNRNQIYRLDQNRLFEVLVEVYRLHFRVFHVDGEASTDYFLLWKMIGPFLRPDQHLADLDVLHFAGVHYSYYNGNNPDL